MTRRRDEYATNFWGGGGGGGSIVAPAGMYFYSFGIMNPTLPPSATNYQSPTPNRVFAIQFYQAFSIKLLTVSIGVGTASAGDSANMALYDASGNLIVDSGPLSTTIGAGTRVTANINVSLSAGFPFFAWAITSVTPSLGAISTFGGGGAAAGVVQDPQSFFSSNSLAGGAMPLTLGTLTNIIGIVRVPAALWKG